MADAIRGAAAVTAGVGVCHLMMLTNYRLLQHLLWRHQCADLLNEQARKQAGNDQRCVGAAKA